MEEYTCDRCGGEGRIKNPSLKNQDSLMFPMLTYLTCPKCLGDKKLNWIERVFGKQEKVVSVDFSGVSTFSESTLNQSQYKGIVDELANNLAKEIDKQIMESFLKESNKYTRFELYYGAKVI